MLPANPAAPPINETSNASVKSCRKIRLRLEPSASRSAISLDRSAARAANKLPRFAHAASRINAANAISPARNARTGLAQHVSRQPRSRQLETHPIVILRIRLLQVRSNRVQIRGRLRRRHARLHMPQQFHAAAAARFQARSSHPPAPWSTSGTQKSGA